MNLLFSAVVIKNNIGYASDFNQNGLFEINIDNWKCKFIKTFPQEDILVNYLHSYAEWIENKIYFIPSSGKFISVFNIETEEIETIEIPQYSKKEVEFYKITLKFIKAFVYNNFLWIVPATYPGILRLDPNTYDIKLIDSWIPREGYLFRRGVSIVGNRIYAASGNNNLILDFNMDSEMGSVKKVGINNKGIMDMCRDGDYFVLAPRKYGSIIKWNPHGNEVEEYIDYPIDFDSRNIMFQYVYKYGEKIIFIPSQSGKVISLQNNRLYTEKYMCLEETDEKNEYMFEYDNKVYFRKVGKDLPYSYFYIDKRENLLYPISFGISNLDVWEQEIMTAANTNCEIIRESDMFKVDSFLKVI